MARVTSSDLSREAKVSRATVSFVLNGRRDQGISEETRQHVLTTAARLGYVPSGAAQSLRRGRSNFVLCFLPQLSATYSVDTLKKQLSERLMLRGFIMAFVEAPDEKTPLSSIWGQLDPAAVVAFGTLSDVERNDLERANIPHFEGVLDPNSAHLDLDQQAIGAIQVNYLADRGHTRIVYIGVADSEEERFSAPRIIGARAAARERNVILVATGQVPHVSSDVTEQLWTIQNHVDFTAVAAHNDVVAAACLAAARRGGWIVPDDLAVIGVDDLAVSAHLDPPLTTVALDLHHMAVRFADRIAHTIDPTHQPEDDAHTSGLRIVRRKSA